MKVSEIILYVTKFLISLVLTLIVTDTFTSSNIYLTNPNNSSNDITKGVEKSTNVGSTITSLFTTIINIMPFIMAIIVVFIIFNIFSGDSDAESSDSTNRIRVGSKSAPDDIATDVMFKDVAGIPEAIEEVERYVDIMRNREKYMEMGATLPRGFLMVGPPGCGKTLLAKAIAGEAGVNFISANGSEFDEMYIGVGASRVRKLFNDARKNAPCIIFIDEIDGIGGERGQMNNREHDKTLNSLLVEMDGFENSDQLIVIGATNRINTLDSALLRSGRFDQQVVIDPPSRDGRVEIFTLYLKNVKLEKNANIAYIANEMAKTTPGINGADVANICNQAAILAVCDKQQNVSLEHLKRAVEDVCIGGQRRSRKVSAEEKKIVAYHECGHAILGYCLKNTGSPLTISIIPRGAGNLGYTLPDIDERMLRSKIQCIEEIAALMGGRIAEEIFCASITGGAQNDIEKATRIAYNMCTQYGMSNVLGKVQISVTSGQNYTSGPKVSEHVMSKVDDVVKKLIDDIYDQSKNIMLKHKKDVENLTRHLLNHEELKKEKTCDILGSDIHNIYSMDCIDF